MRKNLCNYGSTAIFVFSLRRDDTCRHTGMADPGSPCRHFENRVGILRNSDGHMLAATGVAGPAAAVAGGQHRVQAQARHQHRQQGQP